MAPLAILIPLLIVPVPRGLCLHGLSLSDEKMTPGRISRPAKGRASCRFTPTRDIPITHLDLPAFAALREIVQVAPASPERLPNQLPYRGRSGESREERQQYKRILRIAGSLIEVSVKWVQQNRVQEIAHYTNVV